MSRLRLSLFAKYFISLFVAVVVPILVGGVSEAWLGYRDQRARLDDLLVTEAQLASDRIEDFIYGIRDELGWAVQLPWSPGQEEQHKLDVLRLLRQVPAIESITLVDGAGVARVFVSRLNFNQTGTGADLSSDPAVIGAQQSKVWYGHVVFEGGSEPYLTISAAGNRQATGVIVARINLKLIWNVISGIKIGETGHAFVLDETGRLIAHPDLAMVLQGNAQSASFKALNARIGAAQHAAITTTDVEGKAVVATMAAVPGVDWKVVVEQPLREAYAPIRNALWRTAALILVGAGLALALAYALARSMANPIHKLENGVRLIGAGRFDHRINISTGDELEQLALRLNEMAGELAISKERSERIDRLKRFLSPQVAELVEQSGNERLLDGQRREVVAVFADLRGFTAFSAWTEPEMIMDVLDEYYTALGAIITRRDATLTSLAADGLMVLVNAPMPRADPAHEAVHLAAEMQTAVQRLVVGWRERGYKLGFGVGLAMGPATVGRVGCAGRFDYTAIGNVVNLASRLCATAIDGQILVDSVAANAVSGAIVLDALGPMPIKGYEDGVPVFAVRPPGTVLTPS